MQPLLSSESAHLMSGWSEIEWVVNHWFSSQDMSVVDRTVTKNVLSTLLKH